MSRDASAVGLFAGNYLRLFIVLAAIGIVTHILTGDRAISDMVNAVLAAGLATLVLRWWHRRCDRHPDSTR